VERPLIGNLWHVPLFAPEERPVGSPALEAFASHVELLHFFLTHRDVIVERIQGLLNAQRKPIEDLQDGPRLSRAFEDCVFGVAGITPGQSRLRGQLEEAHRASGFRPRHIGGIHNGLIDPGEMMIRGFHLWQQTRWPGRNGRVRYAQTLFNLYVIRCLALLSMRVWDAGANSVGTRLAQVQGVLDGLQTIQPTDQPVFVRDARWLIQLAQSPATDDLGAYFAVAQHIADMLSGEDRLAVHKAGVLMAGGHLRSQTRHYSITRAVPFDDRSVVLITRNSNALDFALLIQDLVPLLDAYEQACRSDDARRRLELAGVVCQGLSADPELFVNRIELLAAYSMIEQLFVALDRNGQALHTPMGTRHARLVQEYAALIGRLSKPLHDDCAHFRPVAGAYSPYGLIYGFASDLLEHMALRTLVPDAVTPFGLEDVFVDGDAGRLAWVAGWRKLPHLTPEVARRFDYPQQFADDVFDRLERALRRRVAEGEAHGEAWTGRLFLVPENHSATDSEAADIPDLPIRYIGSSDAQIVAARKAEHRDHAQLLNDRREGKCLVSYQTSGGWVAISKDVLTEVSGAGHDARIAGLPPSAVGVLKTLYPGLVDAT
jgi:hypothetical protein